MNLALKMNEDTCFTVEELTELVGRVGEKGIVKKMIELEGIICNRLKFEFAQITPLEFLEVWMPGLIKWNQDITKSCLREACEMHLLMAMLVDQEIMANNKRTLAAASLLTSLKRCGLPCHKHKDSPWCLDLKILIGIDVDVEGLAKRIEESIDPYITWVINRYEAERVKLENGVKDKDLETPEIMQKYGRVFMKLYM